MFKINDGYKVELQRPETVKLFGRTKKLIDKKNGEKEPSFEVLEVVLVQCNLVDNQYQQKSNIHFSNKSYAYLLMLKQVI